MKVGPRQLLFAAKLYIAAMAAYTIAVHLGLSQPYWAVVTCCVVMNPSTGAIQAKALYRFTGTVCAGIVSVVLASCFGSVPQMLLIVVGLVAASALTMSFLDRTPRSYGFQLFTITLMIVTVAGVDHPESMFDTATSRVTEIGLGILSTTFVDSVIAPRTLATTFRRLLDRWLPDIERWMADVLEMRSGDPQSERDRLKTVADIAAFSQLNAQLQHDRGVRRLDLRHAIAIQLRLLRMVPILAAIAARLDGANAATDRLKPFLADALASARVGEPCPDRILDRIRSLPLDETRDRAWRQLVHDNIADLLGELLLLWRDVNVLSRSLEGRDVLTPTLREALREARPFPMPADAGIAVRNACGCLLAFTLLMALWGVTGWRQGPQAVLLGTVGIAFFGASDDPGRAITQFGRYAFLALTLAGVLGYGLLPLASDYGSFLVVMALYMLPLGLLAASNPMATLVLAVGLSSINLQGTYAIADLGSYIEGLVATLIGIHLVVLCPSLFREVGVAATLKRYLHVEGREIARLSRWATARARDAFVERALDRIAATSARLPAADPIDRDLAQMIRLRVGANVADLRMVATRTEGPDRVALDEVLDRMPDELQRAEPSAQLLASVDRGLRVVAVPGSPADYGSATRALVGLRIALFGNAPAWRPAS